MVHKWSDYRCSISSSVSNWRERILTAYKIKEYNPVLDINNPVLFFGLYHQADYDRFYAHKGEKIVVWLGSDILQAGWEFRKIQTIPARHLCENQVEQAVLELLLQQNVEARPLFFGSVDHFPLSYQRKITPNVWIHINRNAERESGFNWIVDAANQIPYINFHIYGKMEPQQKTDNIIFHGYVPEKQFNTEIQSYQAAVRLHHFDGFADTLAKSVLMGQWPISTIKYPFITHAPDFSSFIKALKGLEDKAKPNIKGREYYINQFNNPLWNK